MSSSISVFLSRHSNTSLSVIETSFCQFRKFSELGRMLTRVFLDHKTCTQYLEGRFNLTILVIKRALEATGIFLLRSHGLGKLRSSNLFFYERGKAAEPLAAYLLWPTT